ncbi:PHP domain-containing protein [Lacticaseibacillus baoqingensis]|uniref:Histidinol-phosphatase n=1 Tax=Lacticaseibacillus baoqingensis TaxID=2486013 RepID=A0ABW4EAI3_9LACO
MLYYDQHVHTYFSFDSDAQFEDYLAQTQHPFVTTEHLEMANPDEHGHDNKPDYHDYVAKLEALHAKYPNQLLRGIEVGYYAPKLDDIYAYLDHNRYDLILLSFHHNGEYDFQDDHFKTVDKKTLVQNYYQTMLAGVRRFDGADVLAHFEYGLRVVSVTPTELAAWARPTIQAIFREVIAKHMALELNTKSMYLWHDAALYDLVIPWYQALGGRLFTLGSDAHVPEAFQMEFAQAKAFLHAHHITQLATYQDHQPTMVEF